MYELHRGHYLGICVNESHSLGQVGEPYLRTTWLTWCEEFSKSLCLLYLVSYQWYAKKNYISVGVVFLLLRYFLASFLVREKSAKPETGFMSYEDGLQARGTKKHEEICMKITFVQVLWRLRLVSCRSWLKERKRRSFVWGNLVMDLMLADFIHIDPAYNGRVLHARTHTSHICIYLHIRVCAPMH